ncbi:MAG: hypothetical protein JWQ49_5199 [Edaphobacter sp.]|nr:hypothetical protein [Edaphobacter sp.]
MSNEQYYIEPRDDGYALKKSGAERATGIFPTQQKAINRAKELSTKKPHIARVEHTEGGNPDRFRKGR